MNQRENSHKDTKWTLPNNFSKDNVTHIQYLTKYNTVGLKYFKYQTLYANLNDHKNMNITVIK